MQFEVNNQTYVVNFVPEEGRWYVLAPTDTGVVRIPVEVDEPFYDTFRISAGRQEARRSE